MDDSNQKKNGKSNSVDKDIRRYEMYDSVITNRTKKALEKMEHEFCEAHKDDSDKALIDYVLQEALRLGHAPREKEIVGWSYLAQRFGSWGDLLAAASLEKYQDGASEEEYALVVSETERQKAIFKERKLEKSIKADAHRKKMRESKLRQQEYLAAHPEARKRKKRKGDGKA